jgi:hypothetical protein
MFKMPDILGSAERSSKSSALSSSYWIAGIGAVVFLLSPWAGIPIWAGIAVGGGAMLGGVGSYIWGFRYLARTNPDYLRSETYHLNRLALDKSMIGDDKKGLRPAGDTEDVTIENAMDVGLTEAKSRGGLLEAKSEESLDVAAKPKEKP